MTTLSTGTLIVGGGPAGIAPLLAASRRGWLGDLLASGIVIAERSGRIGAGRIGNYIINSDSSAETFLSSVRDNPVPRLAAVASLPVAREVASLGQGAVPLPLVGRLMDALGDSFEAMLRESSAGHVRVEHEALDVRRLSDGRWSTHLRPADSDKTVDVVSNSVVMATGGYQPMRRLESEIVGEVPLLPRYRDVLMQSDVALTSNGIETIRRRLSGQPTPRIVVVGGSTSALACARLLLLELGDQLPPGSVTLMFRRVPKPFYLSSEAASHDGYTEFGNEDICPVSGFVFRFGGLRFDSRELVLQLRGIGGRAPEPRVTLHPLGTNDPQTRTLLDAADIVIACLGYRPAVLPVQDQDGKPLGLNADEFGGALVGAHSGVLDGQCREIPGLYGIGLGAGFVAHRSMGGEPSFRGQMNGLWLWQNDVGALIARQLADRNRSACEAPMARALSHLQCRPDLIASA